LAELLNSYHVARKVLSRGQLGMAVKYDKNKEKHSMRKLLVHILYIASVLVVQ
jgi:hypothetical protein